MLNYNDNSPTTSVTKYAVPVILVGLTLMLFMPSILDKIRGVTDVGAKKKAKGRFFDADDNEFEDEDEMNDLEAEGVLSDTETNVGAV